MLKISTPLIYIRSAYVRLRSWGVTAIKFPLIDIGPELNSKNLSVWAEEHKVNLAFIEPGKPAQNGYIERFNRTYREDILDAYLFSSLAEAREITEAWMEEYNGIRPHESLQGLPPYSYVGNNT